jgi:toxin FitB
MLIDTNILSVVGTPKTLPDTAMARWIVENEPRIWLSEGSLLEIRSGIAKLFEQGAVSKARAYHQWFELIFDRFFERLLPISREVLLAAGDLKGRAAAQGHMSGDMDCCLAATASLRGFPVATLNQKHFVPLGVPTIRPPSDRDPS